jgi:hypothetical protein
MAGGKCSKKIVRIEIFKPCHETRPSGVLQDFIFFRNLIEGFLKYKCAI